MTQVVIDDIIPRTQLIAAASQTVFNTNWTADVASDINVYARADGVDPDDATQLVSSSLYNVTFIGASETVRVTFLSGRTLNDIITIVRNTPAERLNLYINTNFVPSMLNQDFGILTLVDQQAQMYDTVVNPGYNVSATIDAADKILPILGEGEVWVMNSDRTEIIGMPYESGGGGGAPTAASYILQEANVALPNAQALESLNTGFMHSTALTGVVGTSVLTGTANQIDITNGTGAGGDPVFSVSSTLNLPGSLQIQSSTAVTQIINDSSMLTATTTNLSTSAALKAYIDALVVGLNFQGSCVAATTVALTANYSNGAAGVGASLTNAGAQAVFTIDGVSPTAGQRVLIKNQASTFQNGIYTVTNVGSVSTNWILTRATDYDTPAEITPGDLVILTGGTVQANSSWVQTAIVSSVGTDPILFTQFTASVPINVPSGGTGNTTFTAFSLIAAGTTATGSFQSVGTGSTGYLLQSNGNAALPSYTNTPDIGTPSAGTLTNCSGLPIVAGTTGTLSKARGGTGVTSVTTSPSASEFAGWDANSNLSANSLIAGFATTVTAAATTTLTVASKQIQEFTGSTTQTLVMPVTSTLVAGQTYYIINNSSGNVTVNSSGSNAIQIMAANTSMIITCVLASGTTAASWNSSYILDTGFGTVTSVATGTGLQGGTITTTGTVNLDMKAVVGGRLTLTSGVPVTTTDVTAATTIYFTPYLGNDLSVYSGSGNLWTYLQPAEISIAVPATTNKMYDVFVYSNSGTATLELTAWTNDTTRATALTYQNGVLVKSGTPTRRYLGSFRTTGVSGQTEDSATRKRYLFNYYNRTMRYLNATDATSSWTYSSTTLRQANNNTANQVEVVIGVSEDPIIAQVYAMFNTTGNNACVAIGISSTTTSSSIIKPSPAPLAGTAQTAAITYLNSYLPVGYSYLAWLECATAAGVTTWYGQGTLNSVTYITGIVANIRM